MWVMRKKKGGREVMDQEEGFRINNGRTRAVVFILRGVRRMNVSPVLVWC